MLRKVLVRMRVSRMRNRFKFFCFFCVVFVFCFLTGCSEEPVVSSELWVSECLVRSDGFFYEVLLNKTSQKTYLVTDDPDILQEAVEDGLTVLDAPMEGQRMVHFYSYPRNAVARFSEPGFEGVSPENTVQKVVPDGFVYDIGYTDSVKYIRYLLDQGYVFHTLCVTDRCCEVYLCIPAGGYLRCVLFPDQFWCAELYDSAEPPIVPAYFDAWDFNGVLSSLFGPIYSREVIGS